MKFLLLCVLFTLCIHLECRQKRSRTIRNEFLVRAGLCDRTTNCRVPEGYEVDHITPLYAGGPDDIENMQLLTKEEHKKKTRDDREIYGGNFLVIFDIMG